MADDLRMYRIFFASPGDLAEERREFRSTVAAYNESDAFRRGVYFDPQGWE